MDNDEINYYDVMISSTFKDLQIHRKALIDALQPFGLRTACMEFSSEPANASVLDNSLKMVDNSFAFILIIGNLYGGIPNCPVRNPSQLSITELEFDRAQQQNKPIYLFLIGEKHPVILEHVELDAEKRAKLKSFIERAKKKDDDTKLERVYYQFESLEAFKDKLGPTLSAIKESLASKPTSQIDTETLTTRHTRIRAPALYAKPSYLGNHDFVGRKKQLQHLDSWAQQSDRHTAFIYEAIGGSGKSFLAWTWLTEHALIVRPDWAGRFWYSFYERAAQTKDFLLRALVYTSGEAKVHWEKMSAVELTELLLAQLNQGAWLLVLDGIERLLVDYNRFDAEYRDDDKAGTEDLMGSRPARAMIRDEDEMVFRALLTASPSKILITSRLMPQCLSNNAHKPLPGLIHEHLLGLDAEDAEAMFRACGVLGNGHAMQVYLKENCGCHPLVIGALAGLIDDFLPSRGNFDRWKVSVQGGLALNLADLDLKQKQNHILLAALEALPSASRELLTRLAMMLNEFDSHAIFAMGPVDEGIDSTRLSQIVNELEQRGFLLFDRQQGLYNLHPVVRSVVLSNADPEVSRTAGSLAKDYFNAASEKPLREAECLMDVQHAINIAQIDLTLGNFALAYQTIENGLYGALWLNLELHEKNLALLQPFFAAGWTKVKVDQTLSASEKNSLINMASISLGEIGLEKESCTASLAYLKENWEAQNFALIGNALSNLVASIVSLKHLKLASKLNQAGIELARVQCNDENLFTSYRRGLQIACLTGNCEVAHSHWVQATELGSDWPIERYRPGTLELEWLEYLLDYEELNETLIAEAEQIAGRSRSNRQVLRQLHRVRGLWKLRQLECESACISLEKATRSAREVGLHDALAETALAFAKLKNNCLPNGFEVAERLSKEKDRAELELALLWEELGERKFALKHARQAFEEACAEGEPWVYRRKLEQSQAILKRLGATPVPCPSKDYKLIWPCQASGFLQPDKFISELNQLIEKLKDENKELIERHAKRTPEERRIARNGHLIHKLKAKDSTGRWAYYFVLVSPDMEGAFLGALKSDETIDLENYGKVVASCYGEHPNQDIKDMLFEKFGFDV